MRFCLPAILFVATLHSASAAEWYQQEDVRCLGDQSSGAAVDSLTGGTGVALSPGSSPGKYYIEIPVAQLLSRMSNKQDVIANIHALSSSEASSLAKAIKNAATDIKVPLFINVLANIGGGFLRPTAGVGAGILFSLFADSVGALGVELDKVSLFVADGGEVYNRQAIMQQKSDGALYMLVSKEYRVTLGKEMRVFSIFSCLYPISVNIKEFYTVGAPYGQDAILKNVGGNSWRVWDVKEGRWMGEPVKDDLTYWHQSGSYNIFTKSIIENDVVIGQENVRVSFNGGDWCSKRIGQEWCTKTIDGKVYKSYFYEKGVFGR